MQVRLNLSIDLRFAICNTESFRVLAPRRSCGIENGIILPAVLNPLKGLPIRLA